LPPCREEIPGGGANRPVSDQRFHRFRLEQGGGLVPPDAINSAPMLGRRAIGEREHVMNSIAWWVGAVVIATFVLAQLTFR
jgi:hypothetical protein